MARVLIIGATGQTGKLLRRRLEVRHTVFGTGLSKGGERRLDMGDRRQVAAVMEEARPEIVLIPGGWTNVDLCEERPEEAMAVNGAGPVSGDPTIQRRMVSMSTRLNGGPPHGIMPMLPLEHASLVSVIF